MPKEEVEVIKESKSKEKSTKVKKEKSTKKTTKEKKEKTKEKITKKKDAAEEEDLHEDRKFNQKSQLEHLKLRPNMYLGSIEIDSRQIYVIDENSNKFVLEELAFPLGLLKIIDEIVVNAIDHHTLNQKTVTWIDIRFEEDTGEISVCNNGPGIDVIKVKTLNDGEMYKPQAIFSQFLAGDNFEKNKDRIVGGMNGLGGKVTNAFSSVLKIETFDAKRGRFYSQTFRDRLEVIEEPYVKEFTKERIKYLQDTYQGDTKAHLRDTTFTESESSDETSSEDSDASEKSYMEDGYNTSDINFDGFTEVKFIPDYKAFGYKKYDNKVAEVIEKLVYTRAIHTRAFLTNCKVSYNGNTFKVCDSDSEDSDVEDNEENLEENLEENTKKKSKEKKEKKLKITKNKDVNIFVEVCKMFIDKKIGFFHTILKHPTDPRLNMDLCVGISDGKFRHFSLINGICVYRGGTHIKYLSNKIVEYLMPKIMHALPKEQKIHPSIILNNLFIFVRMSVINPSFDAQTKYELTTKTDTFEVYKFKEKGKNNDIDGIWDLAENYIMSSIIGKLSDKPKTRVNRSKVMLKKGSDAKFAGAKKSEHARYLFIAEGDSAMGLIDSGINHKETELKRDYCGVFSIQGVPLNARKEVNTFEDKKNNKLVRLRSEKLQKNVRFSDLVKIMGLDYEKSYDLTPEGDKEYASLRYDYIVISTDADTDGRGMIGALLVNFFTLFWPGLIERGIIKALTTPMIRAYPKNSKGIVKEFYSLHGYKEWVTAEFNGDDEAVLKKYLVNYYKGLASTQDFEVFPTFKDFESKLTTFSYDKYAPDTLDTYFGNDTDARKDVLCTPVDEDDIVEYNSSKTLPISTFLNVDTKEFQRDNIMRKLPHVCDGLVPSRRKTLYAARKYKKIETEKVKVAIFTGFVIENAAYMHGDASLNATIIKMAQKFVGARNLPLLIGLGQFGKRTGEKAGSPRYVYIKINKALTDAIFKKEDDYLLPYVFEEGERVEPEYYCPVIPMCALENMQLPATGWKVQLWARDFTKVMKNVRRMINCEIGKCRNMPIWLRGNDCDIRIASDGKEYMVGKYKYDKNSNTVIITELPIGIFNQKYIASVAEVIDKKTKAKSYIKEIKNVVDHSYFDEKTNEDKVLIHFELQPGAIDLIKEKYDNALKNKKVIMRSDPTKNSANADKKDAKSIDVDHSNESIKDSPKESLLESGQRSDTNQNEDSTFDSSGKSIEEIVSDEISPEDYVADSLFDHIETFFKLRLCINSNINVIDIGNEVKEYKYYSSIVNNWFKERKRLYKERILRQIKLKELYIKMLENIVRFSKERDEMKITNKTPIGVFESTLDKNNYTRFDKTVLMNPKFLPASEFENKILKSESASYNYIIDMTYRSLLKEACIKRDEELAKEKAELAELYEDCVESDTSFIGQKTWLKEFDVAKEVINKGIKDGWDTKSRKFKFD